MNRRDFTKLMNARVKKIKGTLGVKGEVYAAGTDRLSNFKDAGVILSCTPERALQGFMAKHQVALNDFIVQLDNDTLAPLAEWEEKIGGTINYLILLEALVKERYSKINLSCVGTPDATPPKIPDIEPYTPLIDMQDSPDPLIPTNYSTGPTKLDMFQEPPGVRRKDEKTWKDAAGAPDPGAKVRIKELGEKDSYYTMKDKVIGRTGVVDSVFLSPGTSGMLCGSIELDDTESKLEPNGNITLAYAKLEVLV